MLAVKPDDRDFPKKYSTTGESLSFSIVLSKTRGVINIRRVEIL